MEYSIGMKHNNIVKLRDELTKAIDKNPDGADGMTEVTLYGDTGPGGSVLTISNEDMERDELGADVILVDAD